jgi:hypothetical protein
MIIPEDTHIRATITDPKIVHGAYGRQVEIMTNVTKGGDNNEYRGTTFKTWFSFGKDKESAEEYIAYGGPLYQLLSMVAPNLDDVLEDDDLNDKKYEQFIKKAVKELDDQEIVARVGVRVSKKDESKKNNFLQPGTFGLYRELEADEDSDFAALDMGEGEATEKPVPF